MGGLGIATQFPDFKVETNKLGQVVSITPEVLKEDNTLSQSEEFIEDFLEHYGVKGMKWGQRRSRAERRAAKAEADKEVKVEVKPGKGVKTKGGKNREASDDAVNAAVAKQIAKKSGTDALSNKQLQEVVQRMNLEQQYSKLSKGQQGLGEKFLEQFMKDTAPKLVGDLAGVAPKKKK